MKPFDELAAAYPEDTPGGEFVGLSRKVAELLATSRAPEVVCPEIIDFLVVAYPDDFSIDHWYYGYSNPNIIEFCPIYWHPVQRSPVDIPSP